MDDQAMTTQPHRVALVTGGTRGIGLGIARALASDGWQLALCGMRPADSVADVLDELRATGVEVAYEPADLSRTDDRARLVEFVRARFGAVHALVNNAGRAPRVRADLLEATEESFEEVLRTNLQGPYFLTQQIAALMLAGSRTPPPTHESAHGQSPLARSQSPQSPQSRPAPAPAPAPTAVHRAIVFVTSVSAEMVSPNRGEYCVSKAGLAMTAKLFAIRLAEAGIPVYEVRPGVIATDMTAAVREIYDRRIADGLIPEKRWGTAEDVGRAVAALLRGDVPYATGTVLHVDGGLAIPRL